MANTLPHSVHNEALLEGQPLNYQRVSPIGSYHVSHALYIRAEKQTLKLHYPLAYTVTAVNTVCRGIFI